LRWRAQRNGDAPTQVLIARNIEIAASRQNACRKLIEMANTVFPGPDPQLAEVEQSLSLDDMEIERIARTSSGGKD